jgi:hypothetical protein
MRYLQSRSVFEHSKIYEAFDSNKDVRDDIKDIFRELEDSRFTVSVEQVHTSVSRVSGVITISDGDKLFTLNSEIVESILRLIDYLRMSNNSQEFKLYLNQLEVMTITKKITGYQITSVKQNLIANKITEEGIFIKDKLELGVNSDIKLKHIKIKYSKLDI